VCQVGVDLVCMLSHTAHIHIHTNSIHVYMQVAYVSQGGGGVTYDDA